MDSLKPDVLDEQTFVAPIDGIYLLSYPSVVEQKMEYKEVSLFSGDILKINRKTNKIWVEK
jgi:hypothetical protein